MKKIFLTLSMCSLLSLGAFAQLSGGLKAGVNIANQKWSSGGFSVSPSSKVGFHVGGYLSAMLGDKIGIQPELLFSTMGSKGDFFDTGEQTLDMNYITIPVMVKIGLGEMFNLQAGPQFGYLLSAKSDGEDIKDSFKSLDLGAAFGVGVDISKVTAGVRYYLGFANQLDEADAGDLKITNNAVQIYVGIKLFGE